MKRQKLKILISILSIILLFCFNTFSAIVSDNDGSAFVTKAEFDALKNSFNGQINSYNDSIDSKIDGAIASYLAGIKVSQEQDISLFYPVNSSTTYTVKSVSSSYNQISEQYFNNMVLNMTLFANAYNNISLKPWDTDMSSPAGGSGNNWLLYVRRLSSDGANRWYIPTMRGFVFDHTVDSEVITHYYKDDIINIVGNFASHGNGGGGGRQIDVLRFSKNTTIFYNKKINELFSLGDNASPIDGLNAPANSNYKFLDRGSININNYWPTTFDPIGNTSSWGWKIGGYTWNRLADSWMITNTTGNEDKNIYLYNYCDAKIYAHDANEQYVESFSDMSSVGGYTAKNSNLICDSAAQESLAYGYNFDGSDGGKECIKGYWWLFPKIKFKNTYVAQTDSWNNLKQFKNGYLAYQSLSGGTKYPRYYGGLPLFNVSVNNPLFVSGKINIAPTSASYTNANMKLWIKDGEFLNNSDITSYSATEKAKFKTLSAPGCTFDNTEKCLLIPKNTNVTVTITEPKKDEEYFLRFSEVGSAYGGEIKYLDNFKMQIES